MNTLATLTNSGRAAIAAAICARSISLGWGTGEEAWDNLTEQELPSLLERTDLFNEVGRRVVSVKGYCLPDDQGDITVPVGSMPDGSVDVARYAQCADPSPYLYFKAGYDFGDGGKAVIRELGLFMDAEFADGLPLGQQYFTPGQIKTPGRLLAMQILRPSILRSPTIRQTIEFVLPI